MHIKVVKGFRHMEATEHFIREYALGAVLEVAEKADEGKISQRGAEVALAEGWAVNLDVVPVVESDVDLDDEAEDEGGEGNGEEDLDGSQTGEEELSSSSPPDHQPAKSISRRRKKKRARSQ